MEAHCSTGDPCGTVKEAGFFYLRNRCPVVFKKKPHRVFSLRIYFLLLKYSTFTPERQYNPRKFLFFSIFTDCVSLFLRNYLFRMRLFAAGPGGWVGALWKGWQVCGARFPFFCGAMGTPRPCKRFAVFAAAGVCLVGCMPANGTPFSLYNGVRVCCRYAIRFFVPPAPPLIPGFPLPISICASS